MKFLHLSPSDKLEGYWTPRSPEGSDLDLKNTNNKDEDIFPYPEPNLPRISISNNVLGALQAIYPNHRHHILKNKVKQLTFFVYSPTIKNNTKLFSTNELCNKEYV